MPSYSVHCTQMGGRRLETRATFEIGLARLIAILGDLGILEATEDVAPGAVHWFAAPHI